MLLLYKGGLCYLEKISMWMLKKGKNEGARCDFPANDNSRIREALWNPV